MPRGFTPSPPGTVMCQHLVAHGPFGLLAAPRPCKRPAMTSSPYCKLHTMIAAKTPRVEIHDGGFCIGCAQPGRRYVVGGVTITLCTAHQKALERAFREGR